MRCREEPGWPCPGRASAAMVGGVRGGAKQGRPPTKNSPALGQYQLLAEL